MINNTVKNQTQLPTWQSTLNKVLSMPNPTSPAVVNPARPNQNMTAIPTTPTKGLVSAPKISTPATYKGVAMTGSDTDIQRKMAEIDKPQTYSASSNPNANYFSNTPTTPTLSTPTFSGLVSTLANTQQSPYNQMATESARGLMNLSQTNPALVGKAFDEYTKSVENLKNLKTGIAKAYAENESNIIPLEFQQGRAQVMGRQFASQLQAGQEAVNQQQQAIAQQIAGQQTQQSGFGQAGSLALTGQGQVQGALGTAAGLAQPVQLPYSNQYIDPLTGQPIGGGGGSLQSAVQNVVSRLQSGQMTYGDAVQALSGYGQGGLNALQQALPGGFNIAQSNTLAGQQGSIRPAYDFAVKAVSNLENAVSNLPSAQSTNIPILNLITQGVSTVFGTGSQGVQAYQAAIAEARGAIQKVLAATQGGTPTDYVGQSNALLPDNATPNQIKAAKQTLESLGSAKVDIYSNPGLSGSKGGSIYDF